MLPRRRKPTPRTVWIQPGSPSLRRSDGHVHVDRSWSARWWRPSHTSSSRRRRETTDARTRRERREEIELLRRQLDLVSVQERAACLAVDRRAHRRGAREAGARSPVRRVTALMRASSSRMPNGLTR